MAMMYGNIYKYLFWYDVNMFTVPINLSEQPKNTFKKML